MKEKTGAIIFSRMNSSRLPGKALLPIKNNKSLIEIIIERAKKINGIDHICVATSKKESDDILVSKMNELGWSYSTELQSGIERTYSWYIKNIKETKKNKL